MASLLNSAPSTAVTNPPCGHLPADADAAAKGAEPRSIAGTDFRCRGVSWGTGARLLVDVLWCCAGCCSNAAPAQVWQVVWCASVSVAGCGVQLESFNFAPLLPLHAPAGSFALLYEAEWKTRRSITTIIAPDEPDTPKKV